MTIDARTILLLEELLSPLSKLLISLIEAWNSISPTKARNPFLSCDSPIQMHSHANLETSKLMLIGLFERGC
jgi:hypothetical protein